MSVRTPVRMMRNSERSTLKRCATRWHWGWVEGLVPKKENTKLWLGTGVHLALAEWYTPGFERGPHPADTWLDYAESEASKRMSAVWESEEVEWHDAKQMGEYMLDKYVEHYDTDPEWEVIATEQVFNILVRSAPTGNRSERRALARLVGTFDGVYRNTVTGELWLMEHKTAAGISTKHLALDPQAATYHFAATKALRAAGLIGPKEEIVGVMYNFLLKYMPPSDDRPRDADGNYRNKPTKKHFVEAFEEHDLVLPAKTTLDDLQALAAQNGFEVYGDISARQIKPVAEMFERYPVYKSKGERLNTGRHIVNDAQVREAYLRKELPLTKNPTKDCSWDCDFYKLCQLHEQGADWEEYKDLAYNTRDPYEDHGKKSA